ncbi:MAG: hypothetical protein LH660_03645, partial [Phormidesmis sp. CAN_BIN36]|nr:hypothetical protein [Phormidesmis sp. CAN_BIN36]
MASSSQPGSALHIEANISETSNSGQIAIGNGIYQITQHGGFFNFIQAEQAPKITARPTPIREFQPRPFPDLFGREAEIQQGLAALESSQTVEFYGSAGVGKSVLLRHLAHYPIAESLKLFPDGVLYFHLHQQEPMEDFQQQLFEAFYDSDRPFKPSAVRVRHDLHNKRALIILDNASLSQEDIEKLWEIAPNCVFLFTSLERNLWEGQSIRMGGISLDGALSLIKRDLGRRSLTPQECKAAESLCMVLNGHPLEILQQIARVREGIESLAEAAHRVKSAASGKTRVGQLLGFLNQPQRVVLAALAAMGGVGLLAQQASAIADVPDVKSALDYLKSRHLIQQENSRYSLSNNLLESVQQQENFTPYLKKAMFFFTNWAQQATPKQLQEESGAVSHLLHSAVKQGQWNDVLLMAKPFEGALALSGQWELQEQVLRLYQQAAESLGNRTAIAWAAHQSGVRSLCLGNTIAARKSLTKAAQLRQELGDYRGAEQSQHHLNLRVPTPTIPVELDPPDPPIPQPWLNALKRILVPTLVTGSLIGTGVIFLPKFMSSQPGNSTPPSPTPTATISSSPQPAISETPTAEPTPTPYQDPKISSCVAADVVKDLGVYREPDFNTERLKQLAPKDKMSTTKWRQGSFIEISEPIKGWVNGKFTVPCGEKFARAPEPALTEKPSEKPVDKPGQTEAQKQAEVEAQRQAEVERQRQVEAQRQAEAERQRQAEAERQR